MLELTIVSMVMAVIIVILLIKIVLLRKGAYEIRQALLWQLEQDTNALITLSTRDKALRRLAGSINKELALLRQQRRRFQSGNQELKDAITNMAHDLRTPLTAIYGYLDLMEKQEKPKEVDRYLALIQNRIAALSQLTEELFRYSVIISTTAPLDLEDLSLNTLLEESLAAYYGPLVEKGIIPTITMPAEKVIRSLNPDTLRRIFANILSNALKYSDGDLAITLFDTGEIHFSNTAESLDALQVEKLFNRFYTVESARKSTGLGLAIAKTLVEQMGGTITAQYQDQQLTVIINFS